MLKLTTLLPIFLLLFAKIIVGETSIYSNENRSLYVSPKFLSLGSSFQVFSTEPLPLSNPALLAKDSSSSAFLGYTGLFSNSASLTTSYLKLSIDSQSTFGISLNYLIIPGIDSVAIVTPGDSTVPQVVSISSKTASEIYFDVRYSRSLLKYKRLNLLAGGAFHGKRRRLIDLTGYGLGFDVGISAQFNYGLGISLLFQDITTEYTYWTKNYSENGLPKSYLGLGYQNNWNKKFGLSFSYKSPDLFGNSGVGGGSLSSSNSFGYDYDTTIVGEDTTIAVKNSSNPSSLALWDNPKNIIIFAGYGLEVRVKDIVSFRAGISDSRKITFGGGVELFNKLDIDFVYAHSTDLDGSYGVSAKFSF